MTGIPDDYRDVWDLFIATSDERDALAEQVAKQADFTEKFNKLAPGLEDVVDELAAARATIERVRALADEWESSGKQAMLASQGMPEVVHAAIYDNGWRFVELARSIREALAGGEQE